MKMLISWVLLLLGVNLNSGHYIYKVEKEDGPTYEVESNLRGLVLVNTKFEKPSLKDILYHDLLENFYGKEEPLITERSFTNSHGLPFLEEIDNENIPQNEKSENTDNGLFEEPKTLTDEAVKTAFKSKSYLFDQMRQRSDVASEDFIERKKREAEIPYFPEAQQMPVYRTVREPFAPPNTYGMNLHPDGGYVWNNLNNPPSLYGVEQPPNGNENTSQNPPETSETPAVTSSAPEESPAVTSAAPENPDPDSSEDIYVNINRPTPANEGYTESVATEDNPEEPKGKAIEIAESPKDVSDLSNQEAKPDELEIPMTPTESTSEQAVDKDLELKTAAESSSVVPDEIAASSGEAVGNPEGDQVKEMPEAPTLPPLNYDGLPDYIRETISTTERVEYEQTDKPFLPQPSSEDKEMEGIMATAQPVEDIPRTYGMNLTSGSGKVWNDLVNPPVSYEVGSTESNHSEEPNDATTTLAPAIIEDPVTTEQPKPENPAEEPGKDKEPAEENTTPIDIPVVTEQPENSTNEPEPVLPGTENNEESKPTELPEATTETPVISDATESDAKLPTENPETEAPITEDIQFVTGLPEILSTTEEPAVNEDKPNDDIEPVEPVTTVSPAEKPEVEETESGSGEAGDVVSKPEEEPNTDEKPDIMSELLKSEQFWTWLGEWMTAYTELLEKHIRKIAIQEICNARQGVEICPLDKPEDSGSIIKDGKVTIDGKEIDVNQLKRGNKGHSVDATTIYGNSVGNDKVTNVFIFNPNNAKDILEGLKPENNSNVNIIIEENKEEAKGKSEEVTAVPEIEVNKEITEDRGIEDRKDGEAGVPKEDIEATTEKEHKDLKEVEKVTEAVLTKDENTEVADAKAVTPKSSELGAENATEAKLKSEIQQ